MHGRGVLYYSRTDRMFCSVAAVRIASSRPWGQKVFENAEPLRNVKYDLYIFEISLYDTLFFHVH